MDLVVLEVSSSLAGSSIAAKTFAAAELSTVVVHRDEEDVEATEKVFEPEAPAAVLGDVVNQVVAGGGHGGDAAVEPVEEQGPQSPGPGGRTCLVASMREGATVDELVAAEVQ